MGNPVEERQTITWLVGECIMQWATVERTLTMLYGTSLGRPLGPPSAWLHASVFDSVISIDTRLDMIAAALSFQAGQLLKTDAEDLAAKWLPILDEWKSLRKKVRKKYNKRNEVAHSDITQMGGEAGEQIVRLHAFPTLTSGSFGWNKQLLSASELQERASAFRILGAEIMSFQFRVGAALGQFPELTALGLKTDPVPGVDS